MNKIKDGFIKAVLDNDIDSASFMSSYVPKITLKVALRKYKFKYNTPSMMNDLHRKMIEMLEFAINNKDLAIADMLR